MGQDHPTRRERQPEPEEHEHGVLLLGRRQRPARPPERDADAVLERGAQRRHAARRARPGIALVPLSRRVHQRPRPVNAMVFVHRVALYVIVYVSACLFQRKKI